MINQIELPYFLLQVRLLTCVYNLALNILFYDIDELDV
jgi:hypothetical protein